MGREAQRTIDTSKFISVVVDRTDNTSIQSAIAGLADAFRLPGGDIALNYASLKHYEMAKSLQTEIEDIIGPVYIEFLPMVRAGLILGGYIEQITSDV